MFLLIGQGLAGSLLAEALLRRGERVRIVGDARPSSSGVAAGLFNPVTGRKPQKTWLADDLFPYLHRFYPDLETRLGATFFYPTPLYRPFGSAAEREAGLAFAVQPELSDFLCPSPNDDVYSPAVRNEYGGLLTLRAGWVDVPALLLAFRRHFETLGIFEETAFDPADLYIGDKALTWRNLQLEQLVFCEGVYATENPYFGWLPFNPVKGETITVKPNGTPPLPGIVNRGVWGIPKADGTLRVGATYVWPKPGFPLDWVTTTEGREFLEEKLRGWLKPEYTVLEQAAGIRPAVQGRRPLLGRHPEYHRLSIFNGLGSKGVSLAPFFADQLAEHLVSGKELDEAVNISRFFSLYSGRKKG
ncbi:MAG: FAD-binding oxidoreductase [Sphingobacteriaceae bacterium]|nr:FAD-binding oxidoreductase [Cytophagaceae bacterium]